MLKRNLIWMAGVSMVLGLALAVVPARGQEGGGPEGQERGAPRAGGRMTPEEQLKQLTKELKLSDDQQGQVKTILEDRHGKMQKLFQDDSLSREDRRAKMRQVFEESNKKIRGLLNDEQKKKFDEMETRRRERMEKRSGAQNN